METDEVELVNKLNNDASNFLKSLLGQMLPYWVEGGEAGGRAPWITH